MSASKRKKLQKQLDQVAQRIALHEARLATQQELDTLESTPRFNSGFFRKQESQYDLALMGYTKERLERQIKRLDRRFARQQEPKLAPKTTRERITEAKEVVQDAKDRVSAVRERASNWWRKTFDKDWGNQPQLNEAQQVVQQMDADVKRYFPEAHKRQERERKAQAKVERERSRYWDERVARGEREQRQQDRVAAKTERRTERAARRQWQEERPARLEAEAPKREELETKLAQVEQELRNRERDEPQW